MRLLVIDGNSIVNRAFYGIKLFNNKKRILHKCDLRLS